MVDTSPAQEPVTPFGRPAKVAPVTPAAAVLEYVIFVIGVEIQTVCASVPAAEGYG